MITRRLGHQLIGPAHDLAPDLVGQYVADDRTVLGGEPRLTILVQISLRSSSCSMMPASNPIFPGNRHDLPGNVDGVDIRGVAVRFPVALEHSGHEIGLEQSFQTSQTFEWRATGDRLADEGQHFAPPGRDRGGLCGSQPLAARAPPRAGQPSQMQINVGAETFRNVVPLDAGRLDRRLGQLDIRPIRHRLGARVPGARQSAGGRRAR